MTKQIRLANVDDAQILTDLLQPNSQSLGGSLDGDFAYVKVEKMLENSEVTVIYTEDEMALGVIFSFDPATMQKTPVIEEMLKYIDDQDYLIYGPACIASEVRGEGILGKMYKELRQQTQGKAFYAFVNQKNQDSFKAHEKIGFLLISPFSVHDEKYWIIKAE